jgi:hypothetical protein
MYRDCLPLIGSTSLFIARDLGFPLTAAYLGKKHDFFVLLFVWCNDTPQ